MVEKLKLREDDNSDMYYRLSYIDETDKLIKDFNRKWNAFKSVEPEKFNAHVKNNAQDLHDHVWDALNTLIRAMKATSLGESIRPRYISEKVELPDNWSEESKTLVKKAEAIAKEFFGKSWDEFTDKQQHDVIMGMLEQLGKLLDKENKRLQKESLKESSDLIGAEKARKIVNDFEFSGDWFEDFNNLEDELTDYYINDVGVYNDNIKKRIGQKVLETIIDIYPEAEEDIKDEFGW